MKPLETERLLLRSFEKTDLEDFYRYAKSPNIGPAAGWKPHATKQESEKILDSFIIEREVWAIVLKETNRVIGSIGYHIDAKRPFKGICMLGYVLSEDYWGQSIVPEAVKRTLQHMFEEREVKLVTVYHFVNNTRSRRVIEKCGFKKEGTLRMASELYTGALEDATAYSMTREEFLQQYGQ